MKAALAALERPLAISAIEIAHSLVHQVERADERPLELIVQKTSVPALNVATRSDFNKVVREIIEHFKLAIEDRGVWRSLWSPSGPVPEKKVQSLFKLAAGAWCRAHNIDISAEVDIGSGPVDFKFSRGWNRRALVELKLASNSKFWKGLSKQLPQYMRSESISEGYFVAICYDRREAKQIADVENQAQEVSKVVGYRISAITIDARKDNKRSASKL